MILKNVEIINDLYLPQSYKKTVSDAIRDEKK